MDSGHQFHDGNLTGPFRNYRTQHGDHASRPCRSSNSAVAGASACGGSRSDIGWLCSSWACRQMLGRKHSVIARRVVITYRPLPLVSKMTPLFRIMYLCGRKLSARFVPCGLQKPQIVDLNGLVCIYCKHMTPGMFALRGPLSLSWKMSQP